MNLSTTIMSLFNGSSKTHRTESHNGFTMKEGYYGSNREAQQLNLDMSRKELFLSDWNTKKLTSETFVNYKEQLGGRLNYNYFIGHVPQWMKKWNKLPVIDDYEDLRGNFVDTFVHINKIFISDHIERLRNVNTIAEYDINKRYGGNASGKAATFDDISNVDVNSYYKGTPYFQYWDEVQEGESNLFGKITETNASYYNDIYNKRTTGQGRQMLDEIKHEAAITTPVRDDFYAEDYRQLDFWDDNYEVRRSDDQYRYHNQIPIYQKSMQTRHYDRGSEGLHGRGSLVSDRHRKFDLTEIYEGAVAYPIAGYD